jgi:radical SAM superfamily enzyme YgiQ (UPF0313 family)
MRRYKVMLVNAPNLPEGNIAGNYAVFPAMGVVNLGTRLKKDFPNAEVRVIDGGITSTEEIKEEMKDYNPSLVALSVLTPTYSEGLNLAEYAKNELGSTIVLGNDHASFFPELILRKRPYVDYVVQAEFGEEPLSHIVGIDLGKRSSKYPSLVGEEGIYLRTNSGEIGKISLRRPKLKDLVTKLDDAPDLSLIADKLPQYAEEYNKRYEKFHKSKRNPVVINNVRGCGNGEYRCTYCGIYDLGLNAGNPEVFWDIVDFQNKNFGVNFFFEACDSFLTFQRYIKGLIDSKPFDPKERDIEFEIYTRANDVVNIPDSVKWLRELNITRVNLGLDSGDDNMLNLLRKRNRDKGNVLSPSQINYEAVKRLADAGISVHASFPLGALGETNDSLDKTIDFIERISQDYGNRISTLEASELVPLPNSPSWDMLLSRANSVFKGNGGLESMLSEAGIVLGEQERKLLKKKYEDKDLLDVSELAKDWVKYFTHISWNDLEESKKRVEEIAKKYNSRYGKAI